MSRLTLLAMSGLFISSLMDSFSSSEAADVRLCFFQFIGTFSLPCGLLAGTFPVFFGGDGRFRFLVGIFPGCYWGAEDRITVRLDISRFFLFQIIGVVTLIIDDALRDRSRIRVAV